MGDRISLSFVNDDEESVVLFSHWDGRGLLEEAQKYIKELREENQSRKNTPLERMEPNTVMVDFIRWLTREMNVNELRVEGNYYLGKDQNDGDDSDNGHWKVDLKTGFVR